MLYEITPSPKRLSQEGHKERAPVLPTILSFMWTASSQVPLPYGVVYSRDSMLLDIQLIRNDHWHGFFWAECPRFAAPALISLFAALIR